MPAWPANGTTNWNDAMSEFVGVSHNADGTLKDVSYSWADYSADSTITGWSSFTTKYIHTTKIGNMVFVTVNLQGTSNATSVSFTVPYSPSISSDSTAAVCDIYNNSAANFGRIRITNGSTTIVAYPGTGASWTNSGTKHIIAQFWYLTA